MPLATKTTPTVNSNLPDELKNQIINNVKKDDDFSQTVTSTTATEETPKSTAKSKYADSVNLRLTSGKRNEFKKFFTECEISMNQGFEMAVDYILRESKAGRIVVSKSGITKTEEM
ncbi:hypothetical protein [uncultured Treponema sp.]|uniref:hypothetical protein n=1 Tax=uncultured Treponema sp. TaxID=162155 RepID=UPI0025FECC3A|nr:hypothetical protein [uncultured Treponema sp.]